ncbi:MAG: histidine kinase [Clostridiales bacterium GWB2_37_7]|nr:MAG: histidine kinase [Clostridiales bacterium GWB2_37_7]
MYEENTMLLKEIKEYEELRNVFFANLSHELRTPLNVIFSAQQMMNFVISNQTCNDCKNQISKYNRIVKQNCYRLIRLIGNLIDITKIDAKYFEIKKKNCDIVNLVENIAQSVAEYIKDKDIELCFNTDIDKKIIACDPDKVERIMLNLLSNAVKFTPVKGQINVRMRQDQGYVVITVKDTGIGISREMQQAVFERFMQADKSMARNREGSGIGLSLVKSLVDLHQGRISLISEPGKGSEFVIELPDEAIPFEDYVACTHEVNGENIDRINIEFSDIYS